MLSIKNLTKSYNGRTIFKDLSFTVAPGEVLTIVGPSGIGKTTFLNILAGLIPADSGSIELDGKELTIDGTRQGSEVGVIFQDFNLFPQYTVTENITLAPRIVAKEKKATILRRLLILRVSASLLRLMVSPGAMAPCWRSERIRS